MTNISIFWGLQIIITLMQGFHFSVFTQISQFAYLSFEPGVITFLLTFVIVDFTYYWIHRINHTSRFFWAVHSVHHSSTEFNFSTALRLPWVAPFVNWIFFTPLFFLGLPVKYVIASHVLNLWFQYLVHTRSVGKLNLIDTIVNTPSNHRVHHSNQPENVDKNFGGVLMLWDHLFGTYKREEKVTRYGLSGEGINSQNPFVINFKPIWQVFTGPSSDSKNQKDAA